MGLKQKIDRLAMRARPEGPPVIEQKWENLLFLHWPLDPAVVRAHVPAALDLDLFDGRAWVGITPFHLDNMRPLMLPPVPGFKAFHELNVRTYVAYQGVPGIWF